jgi:integration host factor subunit alpha
MTLTKAQIVEKLFAQNIFTKGESAHVIENIFEILKQSLEDGEDVLITGFGKFTVHEKSQRRGRNPQTGESITLPLRRVVTFKCSGVLREKMNKANELIESFLKPEFINEPPADNQWNYIVDIYGKWYRSYFYLCAKYRCPAPNCIGEFFETKLPDRSTRGTENSTWPICGIRNSGGRPIRN